MVVVTYGILLKMLDGMEGAIALYELVAVCKNPSHQVFSNAQKEYLMGRALMQPDGRIHQSIKNIVLSAIEGEGLRLTVVNPIAPGNQ